MKHDTITARIGNVLFIAFFSLASGFAVISIVLLLNSAWYGGPYFIKKQIHAFSKTEIIDEKDIIWDTPEETAAYDYAYKTGDLSKLSTSQLKIMLDEKTKEEERKQAYEALDKFYLSFSMAIIAGLTYGVGRAIRYIFSGD